MNTLGLLAAQYDDLQRNRMRQENRFGDTMDDIIHEGMLRDEKQAEKLLVKEFKKHPAYKFCSRTSGLGGTLGARIIAIIRDPHRFPGQLCTSRHYSPAVYKEGEQCPALVWQCVEQCKDEECTHEHEQCQCSGTMQPPRYGSGVRALWRYCGLHVTDEGKSPRRKRGVQSDWNPALRRLIDMPKVGLKSQIVKHAPEPYNTLYRETKSRKLEEGYKLGHADRIGQTVAVKALLGDLLTDWKDAERRT